MAITRRFKEGSFGHSVFLTLGPQLDFWLMFLICFINVLSLLFYDPKLEVSF